MRNHEHEHKDPKVSVLIIDDEESALKVNRMSVMDLLQKLELSFNEINIHLASNISDAFSILRRQTLHVILLDRDLGVDDRGINVDGMQHIQEILDIQPATQILVVTGHDDTRLAVEAIQMGACGYVVKSTSPDYLAYRNAQILKALKKAKLELQRVREKMMDKQPMGAYVYKSSAMQGIEIQLKTLAQYSTPVLFLSESGLGKTVAAKRLGSLRAVFLQQKNRPFFNINMANIPKDLADSTLFGHERGAFTGANTAKQGLFELANGGDLFLDEIGEASLEVQAKLLKVIEEREFCRVGGNKNFTTTARIILATNKNLKEMVEKKEFREDLYARICTFDIPLPPLEERKEDIPHICQSIINNLQKENLRKIFSYEDLPDDLKEYLHRDNIPFNIRGIRNDLERLMISSKSDRNGALDFSNWKIILGVSRKSVFHSKKPTEYIEYSDFESLPTRFLTEKFPGIKEFKRMFEKKLLEEASLRCQTKKEMAQLLGISESNILSKMDRYNVSLSKEKTYQQ